MTNSELVGSAKLFNEANEDWDDAFIPTSYEEVSDLTKHKISWAVNLSDIDLGLKALNENSNIELVVFKSAEISIYKGNEFLSDISNIKLQVSRLQSGQISKHVTFAFKGGNCNAFCID